MMYGIWLMVCFISIYCPRSLVLVNAGSNQILKCSKVGLFSFPGGQEWYLSCSDSGSSSLATFDPSILHNVVLGPQKAIGFLSKNEPKQPTDLFVTSKFSQVNELISSKIKTLSIIIEEGWQHPQEIAISSKSFIQMNGLKSLELLGFRLKEPNVQLTLPDTLEKLKIASCDIERIAITTSSQQTPALTHLYVSTTLKLILDPQTNKDTYRNLHSNALKFIPSIIYSIDSLKEIDLSENPIELYVSFNHFAKLQTLLLKGILTLDPPQKVNDYLSQCGVDGKLKEINSSVGKYHVCVLSQEDQLLDMQSINDSSSDDARSTTALSEVKKPDNSSANNETITKEANSNKTASSFSNGTGLAIFLFIAFVIAFVAVVIVFLIMRRHKRSLKLPKSGLSAQLLDTPKQISPHLNGDNHFICTIHPKEKVSELTSTSPRRIDTDLRTSVRSHISSIAMMKFSTSSNCSSSSSGFSSSCPETLLLKKMATPNETNQVHGPEEADEFFFLSSRLDYLANASTTGSLLEYITRGNEHRFGYLAALEEAVDKHISMHLPIRVNEEEYICYAYIESARSLILKCHPVYDSSIKYIAKIKPAADVLLAANEHKTLQQLREQAEDDYFSHIVDEIDFDKDTVIDGIRCSVLILEMGRVNLLNIAHGEMDQTHQEAVVFELERVALALEFIHSQGFVHGDIKPENFVLFGRSSLDSFNPDLESYEDITAIPDDHLKMIDFEHTTKVGQPMPLEYTAEYCPPEMAQQVLKYIQNPSINTETPLIASLSYDVWSLGVLILKMYARCKILDEFAGIEDPATQLAQIAHPEFSFERSIEFFIMHDQVKDLVRQCLARDPTQRPSIHEILTQLYQLEGITL